MRFIPSVARLAMVLLLIAGCGDSSQSPDSNDAGLPDAGRADAGGGDAGEPDAGEPDAGEPDAGPHATYVLFEPRGTQPVLPTPNDVLINPDTGRVNLPVRPEDPAAQQEFTRDYLNTLDGFLETSVAGARVSAQLDPLTVTNATVRVSLVDGAPANVDFFVGYNADTLGLSVIAPSGWAAGTRYLVVVLGGSSGVKDVEGRPIDGSRAWQWVRSATPLVDGTGKSTVAGLSDEDAQALERLRLRHAPYLSMLAAQGTRREDVAALWTFTTTSRPRATFDPARSVVSFPNSVFMSGDGSHVSIPPAPSGTKPLLSRTIAGLNALDGFSTTAPMVSENGVTSAALDRGLVAPDSLAAGTRFFRLSGTGPEPSVDVCLDCASSLRPDGSKPTSPQQLQFVPKVPLEGGTTYAGAITTGLLDTAGRPVAASSTWALLRLSAPLIDGAGKSQVSGLPDVPAAQLEPLRLSLKPLLDALETRGLPRAQVSLAFSFRTQSTLSGLASLVQFVRTQPTSPISIQDQTAQLPGLGVPHDQLGGLYEAWVPVTHFLRRSDGLIDTQQARTERAQVLLTVPSATMPAAGWPVVLFAHDLGGDRTQVLLIANELARAGFAAVAMDSVRHGERSLCVGSDVTRNDDNACADPATQRCESNPDSESYGRCVARNASTRVDCTAPAGGVAGDVFCAQQSLGRCVASGLGDGRRVCEGGRFRTVSASSRQPAISGWNMLQPIGPFATRDNFRQAAVDLEQLVRVVRSTELASALGAVKLDGTRLNFLGAGMGAQAGSLFLAVTDDVQRAVLNVPAADPMGLLLTSPALSGPRGGLIGVLEGEGIVRGTPEFDTFIQYQRQALDPADAANAARAMKDRAGVPAGRAVFIQYVDGDAFMPPALTEKFIAAANAGDANRCPVSRWALPDWQQELRHGFLLNRVGDGRVADAAQRQATTFLQTGTVTPPPAGLR